MDKAMDDFLGEFLAETGEALDAIDAALLALERDPRAAEPIRAVFRLMHTIKGTSGFLGLDRLGKLTHVAEDLLGKVRDGQRLADRPVLDAVFAAVDRVKTIIAAAPTDCSVDDRPAQGRRLAARLHGWWRQRRDARLLASFGDRMLDDVGLTRADVRAPARGHLSPRWWE